MVGTTLANELNKYIEELEIRHTSVLRNNMRPVVHTFDISTKDDRILKAEVSLSEVGDAEIRVGVYTQVFDEPTGIEIVSNNQVYQEKYIGGFLSAYFLPFSNFYTNLTRKVNKLTGGETIPRYHHYRINNNVKLSTVTSHNGKTVKYFLSYNNPEGRLIKELFPILDATGWVDEESLGCFYAEVTKL